MASSKRRRQDAQVAPDTPIVWTLPADLLLEIAARSAHDVLLRFASSCKLLRRDILSPSFILRVSHRATALPFSTRPLRRRVHLATYFHSFCVTLLGSLTNIYSVASFFSNVSSVAT